MPETVLTPALFTPIQLGPLKLTHRIVLAPLTRLRADPETMAQTLLGDSYAQYYSERTTPGGLLISEGIVVSPETAGVGPAPGLWSDAQLDSWKPITEAVHRKGGFIFAQLSGLGRVAPPTHQVLGKTYARKSASATSLDDSPLATPLTVEEIEALVEDFTRAARSAVEEAGFDGVEIHAANGFILDQFLQASSNKRTDDTYGGTLTNQFRFPMAVLEACSSAIGPERVGVRISPFSTFQDMGHESDQLNVFVPFVELLLERIPRLGYVHAVEARIAGATDAETSKDSPPLSLTPLRAAVAAGGEKVTRFISAGGYSPAEGIRAAQETGDLIAYGRFFISNPDLVNRIQNGHELSPYDRATFYTPTNKGYTDYTTYLSASN